MSGLRRRRAAGFSLVEAVVSVVLVGVMFAGVVQTVGAGRMMHYKTGGQRRGAVLARQLLAEILQQSYEDPDVPTVALGPDAGDFGSARTGFDDVDDYEGWSKSPPRDRYGGGKSYLADWSREVSVNWVDPADLGQTSVTETKAKRIIVTVKHRGLVMSELTAVRTNALPHVDR